MALPLPPLPESWRQEALIVILTHLQREARASPNVPVARPIVRFDTS